MIAWKVGDRVGLLLPDQPARGKEREVQGVVTAVDPKGVHVKLDVFINGVDTAYATHRELFRR